MADNDKRDVVDDDLYEEIDDEELVNLVEEERKKALERERQKRKSEQNKPKRRFPRWAFWIIAVAMLFHIFAFFPSTVSIPAIDFIKTSAKLSTQSDIKTYKQAVVAIETEEGKGTGFAISSDGKILTNAHVVKDYQSVLVAFPDDQLFEGSVTKTYPDIDLALIELEDADVPSLTLAERTAFSYHEPVYFIGNPLGFHGIANKGTVIDYTRLQNWDKDVIMMKAPVYRGSSGSPVINDDGEVIGVVFATTDNKNNGKVGLFIPIDYYWEYIDET